MALTDTELAKLPTPTDTIIAQAGKDTLLYIAGPTPTDPSTVNWVLVGGQRDSSLDCESDSLDASHKTSGGWKTTISGMKSWSISYSGLQVLNDSGAQIMEYAYRNDVEIHVKIEFKDKSYQDGWGYVTAFKRNLSYDDVATIETTISGDGAISAVTAAS